jgi:hypothetical protein
VYLVGTVKLSTLIYVALLKDTLMLHFDYVSEVVFKQIEIPLSWHTRINPTFIFWWNGQVHRLRPGVHFSRLVAAKMCASVCSLTTVLGKYLSAFV